LVADPAARLSGHPLIHPSGRPYPADWDQHGRAIGRAQVGFVLPPTAGQPAAVGCREPLL